MEKLRKPFQGVGNIIRFNWHYYAVSFSIIFFIFIYFQQFNILAFILLFVILFSLVISYYIYDYSKLYSLQWLDKLVVKNGRLVNIHAGFDETSLLLMNKYNNYNIEIFDFYNEQTHTEISIKRARKRYKSLPKTIKIETNKLPLKNNSVDTIFIIFSAHEIRNQKERELFFNELNRIIKNNGSIIVTEHLRNFPNFIAYNIGFFHFLSEKTWLKTFRNSNLKIEKQLQITPFVTNYKLIKNGTTP